MNTYLVFVFAVVFNALANILMKVGMGKMGNVRNLFLFPLRAFYDPFIISGMISFIAALWCYLYVLNKFNLSIAYPIMTSLGFLLVILASWIFLRETISSIQIIGFILILLGVWMVAR